MAALGVALVLESEAVLGEASNILKSPNNVKEKIFKRERIIILF